MQRPGATERVALDHCVVGVGRVELQVRQPIEDLVQTDAQFQTGEVDIYDLQGIPPLLYQKAKALPGSKILLSASPFVEFIYFNCGKPQFTDKRVRKAI